GVAIALGDVQVTRAARGDVVVESEGDVTIALDTHVTSELKLEYGFRELTTEVNALRKDKGLAVHDRVKASLYVVDGSDAASFAKYLGDRSNDLATEVTASSVSVSASTAPENATMIEAGEW